MKLTLSVRSFQVPDDAGDARLAAQLAFDADLARDRRHLLGEGRQRVGHAVDRVGERGDLALGLDDQLLLQVAVGDRGDDLDDAAHLRGQVARHEVDVVGEVLPDAGDAGTSAWPPSLPSVPTSLRDAGDLAGEAVELIDHRVDGVLQLEDLALDVDGDLLRQVAVGDRRRDERDVAHLRRQVRRHRVDVVGEVLPDAADALAPRPGRPACPRCRPPSRRA